MHLFSRAARVTALSALAALASVAPAGAAERFSPLPAERLSVSAPGTTAGSCRTLATPGAAGVWQRRYAAPAEGFGDFRLTGGRRGDWDLALFDAASGKAVDLSLGFGADEVTQAWMRSGGALVLQACRRTGAPRSVTGTIAFGLAAWPAAPAALKYVRIPLTDTRRQVPLLLALGVDVEENVYKDHAFATVGSTLLDRLEQAGFAAEVVNQDVLAADRRLIAKDAARARSNRRANLRADAPGVPSGRTTYRIYADYQSDLKKLAADHPGLVRGFTMPVKTFQGRDQVGVEISAGVERTDDQKPVSLILGVHHAREWPAGEMPLEYAYYLAGQYGKDARVTKLLDTTRVFVVPIVNPDGFIASRDAIDPADLLGDPNIAGLSPSLVESVGAGGSLAYRRKNCNGTIPSPSVPCDLQLGVDPNRNYGFNWGGPGASTSPNSQSYRGTGQWSEKETQSVHEFSQVHNVTTLVTTHTFGSLVLRPPGLSVDGLAPDEARLKVLGDQMAADTGYASQYSYQLYDTSGTTEDWNYGAAGTYGYTIELGPPSDDDGNFHVAYQRGVIDQWNGTGPRAGLGMRNAYLTSSEYATSTQDFSTLAGKAPAGRTLRLKKTFTTLSAPVCAISSPADLDPIDIINGVTGGTQNPTTCANPGPRQSQADKLEYTTKVDSSGTFEWLVTPSTQPFDYKKGERQAWTLTCEDASGKVFQTREIKIWRGERANLVLPCGNAAALPTTVTADGRRDTAAPQSRFVRSKLRATRKGVFLNGTAKDVAPKGLKPALKGVTVALAKVVSANRCRFATTKGTFGPVVDCVRTKYIPATGTTKWSFAFNHAIGKGNYFAWVRGVDRAGNIERKARTRNLIKFTVK
ncbi:hypothetical protein DSM112329_04018 [Paraconexibacter sp. AEG42_29]|uniref:Peptidase M14 domain-containing protein n=1 Tax=Paraconexibacter sp. AEG42_29 TaxID=2997339 RepID=A0AAU7AZQ8_9ACTN